MAFDRFFIAPYDKDSGLRTNVRPWLIPDQAFDVLDNAYVFRGRVRKRFGSRWLGDDFLGTRLRIQVDLITSGASMGNVRTIAVDAGMPTAVGQAFSIGGTFFTVFNAAGGPQQMYRSDGSAAAATYDLTTSAFNITGTGAPDGTAVYFYPGFPVMGILTYEKNTINDEMTIAFDTRYAYQYLGGWERLNLEVTPGASVWTGDDTQFFWASTWSGVDAFNKVFYVTNFKETEPNYMRFFFNGQWDNFRPQIDATPNYLNSARILIPFKNRLLAFNTWEGPNAPLPGDNYTNRCRYSQIGSPLDVQGWRQDLPGKGNAIDAATSEAIVSVEFVKDRLIVFFERSTWELVYTGNQSYPFVWQKINTELGAESTFSIVPFDKVCLGIGQVGIHACNGANVERIDEAIPQLVFDIHNDNGGIFRVYGIRDYTVEVVYWTLPDTDANADFPFPNRVLTYNYQTATWGINDDTITVFGYFQPVNGVTWSSTTVTWDDAVTWGSGESQAKFRQVIGGNQEGFTFICDTNVPYLAPVLQITDIVVVANVVNITAINHNFRAGEYVYLQNITDFVGNLTLLNDAIFQVISSSTNPITPNTFSFIYDGPQLLAGFYNGGGLIARVYNPTIRTKQYNFYANKGRNAYISRIDFMVDKTDNGQIQADMYASTTTINLTQSGVASGSLMGTGTLDTFPYLNTYPTVATPIDFEATATRLWHPVYFDAEGEVVQLQLSLNDAQMRNNLIRTSDFQLHAMVIFAQPTSYRLQ